MRPSLIDRAIGNVEAWWFEHGDQFVNQQNANRITAAALGGAITVVLVWLLEMFWSIKPTAEVVVAMTTIVQAITQAVYSLFRGWQPKEGQAQSPWWIALLAVLVLAGCASMNFNDALGAAYLTRTTLAETITAECGNTVPDGPCVPGSVISTEDKQAAKEALVKAGSYLADARAIQQGGKGLECSDKWECLEAADGVLDALQRVLIERGVR